MFRKRKSNSEPSVARVLIQAADCQDLGIGIVVAQRPLSLLVPSHLIEMVEQKQSLAILINGIPHEARRILPMPALQRDHLSILQFGKKRSRDLTSTHLPGKGIHLHAGQPISLQRLPPKSNSPGRIVEVIERGDGSSVITDIEVSSGDSGSPLLVSGQLVAVCQGMIQHKESSTAVAVPLSHDGLSELRKLRRRYRINLLSTLIASLLAVAVVFGGFAIYSVSTFSLAAIEVPEDGSMLTASNLHSLTLKPTWSRSFDTPIRRSAVFRSRVEGGNDRIAVGTIYEDGINGAINLLDSRGNTVWSYSVPNGECIYSTTDLIYDGYLVDVIHIADLDEDGSNELLVSFVHDHFFPCKLVIFSMAGNILAEYWHPGYIRTIATGKVGEANEVMLVISASNNTISTDWWNPQTLYAFRGLDIAGQAPSYGYREAGGGAHSPSGTELWYRVIVNIDPDLIRAKCHKIEINDFDGDGLNEIQAALTDGRFYYLDGSGRQMRIDLGDKFHKNFPDVDPPPLVDIWEYLTPD